MILPGKVLGVEVVGVAVVVVVVVGMVALVLVIVELVVLVDPTGVVGMVLGVVVKVPFSNPELSWWSRTVNCCALRTTYLYFRVENATAT